MQKLNFIGIGGAINIEMRGNFYYLKNNKKLLIVDVCEDTTKKLIGKKH
ncbi:MAG: hypothetical protein IJK67_04340 [Bacilli bacterium]|nr:hypothetical protein [Bacilli bacterium]